MRLNQISKPWLLIILLVLSSLEACFVLIWLARIPADPKNALIGPYSAIRLMLFAGVAIAGITFGLLAFTSWRGQKLAHWLDKIRRFPLTPASLFYILFLGFLASLVLLLIPPPSLIPPGSSLAQRLSPLLVLSTLMCAQWSTFIFARFPQELRIGLGWWTDILRRGIALPLTGYILLGLSVLIAVTQIYYIYYNLGDEGNTLTIGWLLTKEKGLYSEVFTHHFPFSYLWVAWVVKLFGPSFFALRLSLILLRTLIFAIAMKLSRYTFALGLTAFSWSLLGHFYLGNGLFYHSFSGMFCVAAFVIGLAILEKKVPARALELGAAGILLGLAILTDPLKLLPAGILVLAVSFSGFTKPVRMAQVKRGVVRGMIIAAFILLCLAIYALWLIASNSLPAFYQSVIEFNLKVYSQYSPRISVRDILYVCIGFLDLFNEQWRVHVSPYFQWGSYLHLDTWIFTSFFFRLMIVLTSLVLLVRRKILSSIYIYLFAAMILVRGSTFFHSSPFVLLSLCVSSLLLSGGLGLQVLSSSKPGIQEPRRIHAQMVVAPSALAWLILFAMFTWLNVRGAAFLIENREKLTYSDKFAGIDTDAAYLREATCNQPEARILIYPYEPIQYFAAQILPASKYHFLLPWVAEVGEEQVISDLARQPSLVLIAREGQVWGYAVQDYLAKLLEYLDSHYLFIEKVDQYSVYRSPKLDTFCQRALEP